MTRLVSFACALLLLVPLNVSAQDGGERLAEVRVHGNHTTPDAEIIELTGVALGDLVTAETLPQVARRLRASGQFDEVEVLKRYRSISDATQVSLIVLVREFPSAAADPGIPLPGPMKRVKDALMFMPILNYADGYGFTYGGRASFVDVFGGGSRVSVPLTWGGTRRAAVEVEKSFDDDHPMARVFSRVQGGGGLQRRENPYFDLPDFRQQLWARADRQLFAMLRAGGGVSWNDVGFGRSEVGIGRVDDRFTTVGADLTFDTRHDPIFPRNAVYLQTGWERMNFQGDDLQGDGSVNRYRNEARGYLGVVGQAVLSARVLHQRVDRPLPLYEQPLLGGASTLRGFRAGSFAGDNLFTSSLELRVPLSSPMGVSRLGVSAFVDAGAVYGHGTKLRDATFHQGAGGGVFLLATVFQLNFEVAHGIDNQTRFHFTTGFQF